MRKLVAKKLFSKGCLLVQRCQPKYRAVTKTYDEQVVTTSVDIVDFPQRGESGYIESKSAGGMDVNGLEVWKSNSIQFVHKYIILRSHRLK